MPEQQIRTGTAVFTSLNGVAATGAGANTSWYSGFGTHTMVVVRTGTISALTVALEGSHDGTNWLSLATTTATAAGATETSVTGKVFNYLRANVTAYTGTGTVSATIASI